MSEMSECVTVAFFSAALGLDEFSPPLPRVEKEKGKPPAVTRLKFQLNAAHLLP